MKIQNQFTKSIVQNDADERLTDNDLIGTPQNISIITTTGNNGGVLKNVPGNSKKTNFNIAGGKTIGKGKDETNENVYDFIKGTLYDYVIEYNTTTNTSAVVLQSSTGGVLNFRSGERITNFNLFVNSENGDIIIAWSGDSNPPRIVNVTTAKTWAVDGFTNDEISVMKPSPIFAPTTSLTTSVDGVENNFIEDKMLCFAYRYKYKDGYYSAPSSWSKIAFTPKAFSLDYQTYENNAMVNLANAVNVGFNVGPREVIQVDLLFRESNSSTVFVCQQFIKADEGWGDNTSHIYQFSKAKIYTVLAEDQFFRNFDNVPLSVNCQTAIGSRIAYANFIEGRDLGVVVDFEVSYESVEPDSVSQEGTIENEVTSNSYSNVIDWVEGIPNGGSSPVDQMDYTTNTLEAVLGSSTDFSVTLTITPKPGYNTVPYSVYLKDGASTIASWTDLTGAQTVNDQFSSDHDIKFYITSDDGILYDCDLQYNIIDTPTVVSQYKYTALNQLSYPKSGGYGSTLVGDTIIKELARINMSNVSFISGEQIRITLVAKSSLVDMGVNSPNVTFFYNITSDYTDLTEFLAGSDFAYQLETVFSLTFKSTSISNEGPIVSYDDFVLTQDGNDIVIRMPQVVYTVTEPSGVIENKNEFFLLDSVEMQVVNEDAYSSMHSNRDYEVGLIYMDEQGRKTTVLNSPTNAVFVPTSSSNLNTKLHVVINNNPPSWAKYYKFLIKQVKRDYETIYGSVVYEDGIYRWIKLEGNNKSKVKEGDTLILKSDYSGPLEFLRKVLVIEVSEQKENFIPTNTLGTGAPLVEQPGLYFKIKQGDFNINLTQDAYKTYAGSKGRRYATNARVRTSPLFGYYDDSATPVFIPDQVNAGSQITFKIEIKAYGNIAFNHTLNIIKTAQDDYATIRDWFEAEIENSPEFIDYRNNYLNEYGFELDTSSTYGVLFWVTPWRNGTASRDIYTDVVIDANFAGGTLVFETEPIEELKSSYFELPTVYTITNGQHQFVDHILHDGFNCFAFGNGVESYKIKDALTGASFSIDSNPNDINKEGYKQINRYADITYSEVYESSTAVNRLNEFNLYLANYKNDLQKEWGPINVMKGFDTNLDIIQEDKYSIVYYGKDLLYNADGTTNLAGIPQVLGQQKAMDGEFGCQNIDSFDFYGFNRYFADVKRGVVLKKANNGIFEISNQGMRSYFKRLFRDNTINNIITEYDQFNDVCFMTIQYNSDQFVTWMYSDIANGWLGTQTFNPEDMSRVNGAFYSFKNGEIYLHNDETAYNTFYGTLYPSIFEFNFSQGPSQRKIFKTIEIEGSHAWKINALTNSASGYVNESDFEKKEGFYYAYIRGENGQLDTAKLNYQGIGNATATGLVLSFGFELDPIISVGDVVININLEIVGTIQSKTSNSLTLNTVNNFTSGEFVLCVKPESVQAQGVLGYYNRITAEATSNTLIEVFAINSDVTISNPI